MIPARRNWFAIPFLSVWLAGWSLGGVGAITILLQDGDLFIALWLVAWAIGWIGAGGTIMWQLAGREVIAINQGDLESRVEAFGLGRSRFYRASEVRDLRVQPPGFLAFAYHGVGIFMPDQLGVIRFDHGARTIGLATGVDEAEGKAIRDWLLARLPTSARA